MKVFKNKGIGFYAIPVIAVFSIVSAILYITAIFGNSALANPESYYKLPVFLLMLLGGLLALALAAVSVLLELLLGKNARILSIAKIPAKAAAWVVLIFLLTALIVFAPSALDVMMRVSMGLTPWGAAVASKLIPTIVFMVLAVALSVAGVFLRVYKKTASPSAEEERAGGEPAAETNGEEAVSNEQ